MKKIKIDGMSGFLTNRVLCIINYMGFVENGNVFVFEYKGGKIQWEKIQNLSPEDFLEKPNIGVKTLEVLETFLKSNGMSLRYSYNHRKISKNTPVGFYGCI